MFQGSLFFLVCNAGKEGIKIEDIVKALGKTEETWTPGELFPENLGDVEDEVDQDDPNVIEQFDDVEVKTNRKRKKADGSQKGSYDPARRSKREAAEAEEASEEDSSPPAEKKARVVGTDADEGEVVPHTPEPPSMGLLSSAFSRAVQSPAAQQQVPPAVGKVHSAASASSHGSQDQDEASALLSKEVVPGSPQQASSAADSKHSEPPTTLTAPAAEADPVFTKCDRLDSKSSNMLELKPTAFFRVRDPSFVYALATPTFVCDKTRMFFSSVFHCDSWCVYVDSLVCVQLFPLLAWTSRSIVGGNTSLRKLKLVCFFLNAACAFGFHVRMCFAFV